VALGADAGLPASRGVPTVWGKKTLAETAAVVEQQRQAAQVLRDASKQFAAETADSPLAKQLVLAKEKFGAGDYADAIRLASTTVTGAFNLEAAGKVILIAKRKQAAYSPGFLERIGLLLKDPDGDLASAEAAYAAGDGATALGLAQSASGAWDDSRTRGLSILSILAGVMCAASVGTWLLLRRNDSSAQRALTVARGGSTGHVLEASESKSRWKDWENIP
ncbi:MAG: hypothetical protein ABI782_08855, partial [Anaerolineaceae bacterium]